jgi:ribosomal protein L37AE/L43A
MTREEFDRQRSIAAGVEKWQSRMLAAVVVPLGFAQLFFIKWLDTHAASTKRLRIEGSLFLAYMALVLYLIWRMVSVVRKARPKCPKCKAALSGMSERMAVTTGKCDRCGAELFSLSEARSAL